MEDIKDKLVKKSIEAFILGLELYNKPTIKYRVEGFAFMICNAWELMLKAKMLDDGRSIYYKDSDRSLSLEACIKTIFTNNKDPLRLNLESIIVLRNTSTHYITEEYEGIYVGLFQACVLNFDEMMKKFHNVDLSDFIPQNFLTLSINLDNATSEDIVAKYPKEIADKLIGSKSSISNLVEATGNSKLSITINHLYFLTKNKDIATATVAIDKNSDSSVKIVKQLVDPKNTHPYNMSNVNKRVNSKLEKAGIKAKINQHIFTTLEYEHHFKKDSKYTYVHYIGKSWMFTYSEQLVDFLVELMKNKQKKS